MTIASRPYVEEAVQVCTGRVHVLKGGTGEPLVINHHDTGNPGWLPFYELLARHFAVYIPTYPGCHQSDRPAWMRSVRDLAVVQLAVLKRLGIEKAHLVGLGYGGWVAAEMATMSEPRFKSMVLVCPMGVQPAPGKGEIMDQFLVNTIQYTRAGFYDQSKFDGLYGKEPPYEQLDIWETNREMTERIAWKPYMFNQAMPYLLKDVDLPTLVVFGKEDRVVPVNCGELYAQALPHARLHVVEQCGHYAEIDKPEEVAKLVLRFLGRS